MTTNNDLPEEDLEGVVFLDELGYLAYHDDPEVEFVTEQDDNAPHGHNSPEEMDGSR
jgi:hypothetical protein